MKTVTKNWLIILIVIFGFLIRFYKVSDYPALNADEAAIGYNAYSLIKTGLDEHGNPWPVHFQSFNDFKPGLYFYMVMPFIKILGLTEIAVRLPNIIMSSVSIWLIYLLTKLLFPKIKHMPEIAAFFLTISPWHLHFSRGGWEVGSATTLIMASMIFLIRGLKESSKKDLIFFSIFAAASLYIYHSARVIMPILAIGTVCIFQAQTKKNFKNILVTSFVGIILLLPLIKDFSSGDVLSRAAGVGLFADPGPLSRINEQRGEHVSLTSPLAKILHNRPVNYGLAFLSNWASHYHGEFLFLTGDSIERNKVPELGQAYLFDILLICVGLFAIFRNFNVNKREFMLVIFWIIIAPIPAALTFQAPHALRAQNMVIPLILISSFGLISMIKIIEYNVKKVEIKKLLYVFFAVFVVWDFSRYLHMYYTHMSKQFPYSSQYGVKELVKYVNENSDKYDNIIVTERYDQPYILFLFYLNYSPEKFQTAHSLTSRDTFGFSTVKQFDKFHFQNIDFEYLKTDYPKSLIIGTEEEIPKAANVVKQIKGTNDYTYFYVVAN